MPTATNHTYLVRGTPQPSKKGGDDWWVGLMELDGTPALNPTSQKQMYVSVAPNDIALINKVHAEGRLVKKAKNFDYIPNVGTKFLPDQTIDNFELPGHDDDCGVDDQDPPMSWTTVAPLPDVKPIDANIQEAINSYSGFVVEHALALMKRYPMLPFSEARTIAISYECQKNKR